MAKYLQNVCIDCTLLNNCGEKVQIPPIKRGEKVQIAIQFDHEKIN